MHLKSHYRVNSFLEFNNIKDIVDNFSRNVLSNRFGRIFVFFLITNSLKEDLDVYSQIDWKIILWSLLSMKVHKVVSSHSGTPLGVGTSHEHFRPQDSPRPGLGGSHHLPPYSILYNAPLRLHPNGSFSRDSQVGVSKLSRNCPGWSLGTLGAHNSQLPGLIVTRSKPKL